MTNSVLETLLTNEAALEAAIKKLPTAEQAQFRNQIRQSQLEMYNLKGSKAHVEQMTEDLQKAETLLQIARLFYYAETGDDPVTDEVKTILEANPFYEALSVREEFSELKILFQVLKSLVKLPPFVNKRKEKTKDASSGSLEAPPEGF
jgi:hypothetical protein